MRLAQVLAIAGALAALWQPLGAAAAPRIDVVIQLDEPTLDPGSHTLVGGRVALTFPADESCSEDLDVRFVLLQTPDSASITLEPSNWTVPGPSVAPNATVEHEIQVTYDVASNASAYDFLLVQVSTVVPVCGNVQSALHTMQLTPRVTFRPSIQLDEVREDEDSWTFALTNTGNGALAVAWRLLQPSRGRVITSGETWVANPFEDPEGARVELEVRKQGVDHHEPIILNATLGYAGDHTPLEPRSGFFQAQVRSDVNPSSPRAVWVGIIAGIGLALLIVGLALWKRRRA